MPDLSDLHLCVEPSLIDRLRKNISDNMPTGSHRERARAWATLARRCQSASEAHQRVADERDATRQLVRSFAPAYRSAVLGALKQEGLPGRALTAQEQGDEYVWTGRFYRGLTPFELRSGRTFEPTLDELTEDEQTP